MFRTGTQLRNLTFAYLKSFDNAWRAKGHGTGYLLTTSIFITHVNGAVSAWSPLIVPSCVNGKLPKGAEPAPGARRPRRSHKLELEWLALQMGEGQLETWHGFNFRILFFYHGSRCGCFEFEGFFHTVGMLAITFFKFQVWKLSRS